MHSKKAVGDRELFGVVTEGVLHKIRRQLEVEDLAVLLSDVLVIAKVPVAEASPPVLSERSLQGRWLFAKCRD